MLGAELASMTQDKRQFIRFITTALIAYLIASVGFRYYLLGTLFVSDILQRYDGFFTTEVALPAILLLYNLKRHTPFMSREKAFAALLLALLALLITYSRSSQSQFILCAILIFLNSRILYRVAIYLLLSFCLINLIWGPAIYEVISPQGNVRTFRYDSFINKNKNSLNELIIADRYQPRVINQEWRGYEAYLGRQHVVSSGIPAMVFGLGFTAITKLYIFEDGSALNNLPIFHNGYITIFQKAGALGLLFFFLFIFQLTRKPRRGEEDIGELLSLCAIIILIETQLTHGIFKQLPPCFLMILIGGLLALKRQRVKRIDHDPSRANDSGKPSEPIEASPLTP